MKNEELVLKCLEEMEKETCFSSWDWHKKPMYISQRVNLTQKQISNALQKLKKRNLILLKRDMAGTRFHWDTMELIKRKEKNYEK